jgi:sporulation protein YlmC with PRC-barrel domain
LHRTGSYLEENPFSIAEDCWTWWSALRVAEEILGKIVVDSAGSEVGKTDDVEIEWDTKDIAALVVKGKGFLSRQFGQEEIDALLKKLRIAKTEDLLIPVDDVQAIGKYVVLTKKIELNEPK